MPREAPIVAGEVTWTSAIGPVHGFLARPDTKERLPILLLIHGETGLTAWMKESTKELASIGYLVLAADLKQRLPSARTAPDPLVEEKTLAELSAAVRWLRRRPDVLPAQAGVVGWSWGAEQALALVASMNLQACVICERPITADTVTLAGLRGTALLGIVTGKRSNAEVPTLRKVLADARIPHKLRAFAGAETGFMDPAQKSYRHDDAEAAWVEIYEFLGHYVEDAPQNGPPSAGPGDSRQDKSIASIADIMRAVNEPTTGVRGTLIRGLEQEPASPRQWERVRANAALVAEAGKLLQQHTPRKGPHGHYLEQARAFTNTAETIVTAVDRRDYPAANGGMQDLAARCASCHQRHR